MNSAPLFVNAMLCVKAIISGLDRRSYFAETTLLLPEDNKAKDKHIRQLKGILRDYLMPNAIYVTGTRAKINLSKINHKTDIRFFHAGNYPAI